MRTRMLGQRFARQSHDCGCGSVNLKTTSTAAVTLYSTKRINADVTDLTRSAVSAAPKLAVENDSTAYAGAKCQANDRTATAPYTLPHLAEGGSIRIVLEQHRPAQRTLQCGLKFISE